MDLPTETDFVVVGAGVAGLRAAIELAEAGRVLIINKKQIPSFKPPDSKSDALWLSDEDDISPRLQDTLASGDGLCNPEAVKTLVNEGAERIDELIRWDTRRPNQLTFELENAHTKIRSLHSQGASTGKEVLRVLCERVQS